MPFGPDNIIQHNAGNTGLSAGDATVVVSLPGGTTEGNTVIVNIAHWAGANTGITTPAGWKKAADDGLSTMYQFYRADVPAGESSWGFSPSNGATVAAWSVVEVSGIDPETPLDVSAGNGSMVHPQPTGTAANPTARAVVAVAAWGAHVFQHAASAFSGYPDGWTELDQSWTPRGEGFTNAGIAHAFTTSDTYPPGGAFSAAAEWVGTSTEVRPSGVIGTYRDTVIGSFYPLLIHTGFEYGTIAGANRSTIPGTALADVVSNATVTGAAAYDETYGLRLTAAGTVARYGWTAAGALANTAPATRGAATLALRVRVVSATGTVVLARIQEGGGRGAELVYNAGTSKLGVRLGSTSLGYGTIAYQNDTFAVGDWIEVQLRYHGMITTTRYADWTVGELSQPEPAAVVTTAGTGLGEVSLGYATAQTCVADYDTVRVSAALADYPIPQQKIVLLTPDTTPGQLPAVSGSTANFATFTANGTIGAWDPATAAAALSEIPPTIGAGASGAAQITNATTEFMQFPMSTYTLQPGEKISAVRVLMLGWAGSTSPGSIGLRAFDGIQEYTLLPASDAGLDNSTTAPVWLVFPWEAAGGWSQAQLDNARLRLGFSPDASPDQGAHVLYLEVAIDLAPIDTGMVTLTSTVAAPPPVNP
jgi:hypothetical protein